MLEVFPITVESHQSTSNWHIQIWEENANSDNLHARIGKISSGRGPDIFFFSSHQYILQSALRNSLEKQLDPRGHLLLEGVRTSISK